MNGKGQTDHPQQHETTVAEIGVTRRELMQRASMLGLAAAFGGFGGAMPAFAADFDMKKYAGTKISLLMTGDENDHRVLAELMPQFVEETGMELEITSPALGALIEKTLQNLKAERSSFDLINYLGFLTTQQVGGGYYDQLNAFIDNPEKTPPDWDIADIIPAAMKNVGIFDMATGTVGQGNDIYGIPGLHSG